MTNNSIFNNEPISKEHIKTQIYEIRNLRTMLDSDIAAYFGVETKALNRAMKRNIERFPNNFCFQLTSEECSRCQIGTLNSGRGSNIKYLPYVYTEQGISMLTSCLHTERAINASIQIMEAFVEMKHYLINSNQMLPYQELQLISKRQDYLEADLKNIKSDLLEISKLFSTAVNDEEILMLDGKPFIADVAFARIYNKAKSSVIVIDNYIGIKTLLHLSTIKKDIKITIISDNKARRPLSLSEINDFSIEYPGRDITFIKSGNKIHDRYIAVDYGTKNMKVYLCGSSSKDSGNKITTIIKSRDASKYNAMIKELLKNPILVLK